MSDSSRRPVAAFIVNPVGVADLDEFREKAAAALAQRDWAEPIWWDALVVRVPGSDGGEIT